MQKHEAGKGSYGYSYELEIEVRAGKQEWNKYVWWFPDPTQRDIAMNLSKRSLPKARKLKRVGK